MKSDRVKVPISFLQYAALRDIAPELAAPFSVEFGLLLLEHPDWAEQAARTTEAARIYQLVSRIESRRYLELCHQWIKTTIPYLETTESQYKIRIEILAESLSQLPAHQKPSKRDLYEIESLCRSLVWVNKKGYSMLGCITRALRTMYIERHSDTPMAMRVYRLCHSALIFGVSNQEAYRSLRTHLVPFVKDAIDSTLRTQAEKSVRL